MKSCSFRLTLLLFSACFTARAQSVGIGTATPDAKAALDIRATDRGLLIPRLTAAQRTGIAAPPQGLMVYQTDGTPGGGPQTGFWYYGGAPAAWVFITPAGGGADDLGNHTATTNLNLQANALVGTGASVGTSVGLGVRADGGLNLGQNGVGNNVFVGYQAGQSTRPNPSAIEGITNQFLGYQAGQANTTGVENQFSGYQSGYSNTTGVSNQFCGYQSGFNNTTGIGNQFDGTLSGYNNTTGSENQFSGYQSGYFNTTGSQNQFSGIVSGYSNTTGSFNQFSGYNSGAGNTTGGGNVFMGYEGGFNNITGIANTAIGYRSGPASDNLSNTLALGNLAKVSTSNTIQLGNANITALRCQVGLTVTSDARFKYDVRANVPGLAFIQRLRPVTYRFDAARLSAFTRTGELPARSAPDAAAPVQTGFLAQEVEAAAQSVGFAFDGVHAPANARDHYGLGYAEFVVPLVRAVQEQQALIEALQQENAALRTRADSGRTAAEGQAAGFAQRLRALEAAGTQAAAAR